MNSVLFGIPLTLFSSIGLLLNGYILFVIILTKQSVTANNLLLMHLGIVDTLLGIHFLIFAAPSWFETTSSSNTSTSNNGSSNNITSSIWLMHGSPACTLNGFLFTLLHPVALWTICGLNCDRYYAIAAPLHYAALVNPKKVAYGLAIAWFISLLLCVPPLLFSVAPYSYSIYLGGCAPDFTIGDGRIWYSTVYTALTLLLPTALILGCNIKVLMIARYHRHRIASAIYEVTLSAQVTITHQRNPFFVPTVTAPNGGGGPRFRSQHSAISTVLQLLISLLFLYFPYYLIILWNSFSADHPDIRNSTNTQQQLLMAHSHLCALSAFLITCAPSVNGLLYGIKSKTLRKTFQNYWRKQMSKSEMNQEIQARTPSTCGSRRPSLTPLGILSKPSGLLLTKPNLQRRLSEALLDRRQESPQRTKIKRIASEQSWRPSSHPPSTSSLLFEHPSSSIPHTSSCNTLQVPDDYTHPSPSICLSFKIPKNPRIQINGNRKPRILITRALSEESDKTMPPAVVCTPRKHSISTTVLLERRLHFDEVKKVRVLDRNSEDSSSEGSSSGKLYMSLDERVSGTCVDDSDGIEETLLLSWPQTKKVYTRHSSPKLLKNKFESGESTRNSELIL